MPIHSTAIVDESVQLNPSVQVWHFSHIRERVLIGSQTKIGSYVYIGPGVEIGKNCKIQNGARIFEKVVIEDGVFFGPNAVIVNDRVPRAVNVDQSIKTTSDWQQSVSRIGKGASIGAGAVCVSPVTIGDWAMVGAGSVVTKDIPAFALVFGNPAKFIGWVGRAGFRLTKEETGFYMCPKTNEKYELVTEHELVLR